MRVPMYVYVSLYYTILYYIRHEYVCKHCCVIDCCCRIHMNIVYMYMSWYKLTWLLYCHFILLPPPPPHTLVLHCMYSIWFIYYLYTHRLSNQRALPQGVIPILYNSSSSSSLVHTYTYLFHRGLYIYHLIITIFLIQSTIHTTTTTSTTTAT